MNLQQKIEEILIENDLHLGHHPDSMKQVASEIVSLIEGDKCTRISCGTIDGTECGRHLGCRCDCHTKTSHKEASEVGSQIHSKKAEPRGTLANEGSITHEDPSTKPESSHANMSKPAEADKRSIPHSEACKDYWEGHAYSEAVGIYAKCNCHHHAPHTKGWEKEWTRRRQRQEYMAAKVCMTCGQNKNHNKKDENGSTYTHQFDFPKASDFETDIDFISRIVQEATEIKYAQGRADEAEQSEKDFDKWILKWKKEGAQEEKARIVATIRFLPLASDFDACEMTPCRECNACVNLKSALIDRIERGNYLTVKAILKKI